MFLFFAKQYAAEVIISHMSLSQDDGADFF